MEIAALLKQYFTGVPGGVIAGTVKKNS